MRPFRRNFNFRIYRFPKRLFKKLLFFSLLMFLSLSFFLGGFPNNTLVTLISPKNLGLMAVSENNLEGILDSSIPMLAVSQKKANSNLTGKVFENAFYMLAQIQLGEPSTFLQAEIPYLRDLNFKLATADDPIDESKKMPKKEIPLKPEEPKEKKSETVNDAVYLTPPLVGIYHTHTGETYALSDKTERVKGQRGGVYLAGAELKKVLEEKYKIGVAHSDVIHDYDYVQVLPYGASEKTAAKMLAENPSIEILIDLHRDAVKSMKREQAVVDINGEKYATMFLVVGSNKRQNFPNWEKNYEFAKRVSDKVDKLYPGLLRKPPKVQAGRYNQQLHPRAILIEIGEASNNSTEESVRTARLFAHVLAEVLNDMKKEKS